MTTTSKLDSWPWSSGCQGNITRYWPLLTLIQRTLLRELSDIASAEGLLDDGDLLTSLNPGDMSTFNHCCHCKINSLARANSVLARVMST